jgi:hypothetical protein
LPDSTHTPRHRPLTRPLLRAIATTAILPLLCGWLAPVAGADGDPASDVLASQPLFLPQDASTTATQQAQLAALLQAAQRTGYQIRVALIASPADLGSLTELWRQPQNYARFLGQELSLVYRRALLVVMPNGYGLYRAAGRLSSEQSTLAGLSPPGAKLGTATLTAIQRLAAASGRTVALPTATAPSNSGSTDTISWIAFAIGSALILLAWTASLRARPMQIRGQRPESP